MSVVYSYDGSMAFGLLTALLSGFPGFLLGIGAYVLSSLALYTVAKRRGLNKPWLAWVPVLSCWILGSLSDQYRYVVLGQNKGKRKILLVLKLLMLVLSGAVTLVVGCAVMRIIFSGPYGMSEEAIFEALMGPMLGAVGFGLPLAGIAIAMAVIRYMALYDIFKSMDPENCVLFLIVSILCTPVFRPTEGLFLFFNRNKDLGMPPRREEPFYEAPRQEPWEQKDYL